MNKNYNAAQPAFTANLVVRGIKLNSQKFEAVQKRFSQLTEHYKADTLTISPKMINGTKADGDAGHNFHIADFTTENSNPASILYLKDFKNWFENGSVEGISKALARIFKSGKFSEIQDAKIAKMKADLERVQHLATVNTEKAKLTQRPVFEVLAAKNNAKAEAINKEMVNTQAYTSDVLDKIQDCKIDAPLLWWDGNI